jgi:hypothetical protein
MVAEQICHFLFHQRRSVGVGIGLGDYAKLLVTLGRLVRYSFYRKSQGSRQSHQSGIDVDQQPTKLPQR